MRRPLRNIKHSRLLQQSTKVFPRSSSWVLQDPDLLARRDGFGGAGPPGPRSTPWSACSDAGKAGPGVRRGRGRPPHIWLRLCCSAGQADSLTIRRPPACATLALSLLWLVLALIPLSAATDLDARLARFRQVRMPFDSQRFTARERSLASKLVEACQHLELIFWQQSDPDALALYRKSHDPKLRRLLMINGSRWDFIDEHHPFVGAQPMPPGHALYPPDLTRGRIESYVKSHPEK